MRLIIVPSKKRPSCDIENSRLRFAVSNKPISNVILEGLIKNPRLNGDRDVAIAIPERWRGQLPAALPKIYHEGKDILLSHKPYCLAKRNSRFVISNGRFATRINTKLLENVLLKVQADVVTVNVEPQLRAYREKVLLTTQEKVAGFRRVYSDTIEPARVPDDWPHHVFIKTDLLKRVLAGTTFPIAFLAFLESCRSNELTLQAIRIGGTVMDLETDAGLLGFLACSLNCSGFENLDTQKQGFKKNGVTVGEGARLFGKVLCGENVRIGENAIIAGPTVVCNGAEIAEGAVVRASIIGPDVSVPPGYVVQKRVLIGRVSKHHKTRPGARSQHSPENTASIESLYTSTGKADKAAYESFQPAAFRTWPCLSYPGWVKRIADMVAAIIVLIPFAPVIPIIAAAIKLSSSGPIFFKDKRQGLHGKVFNCLKFRTMVVGADKIQDKLRAINEADGPQFKISDDPRLSAVGRFLRDTCIDEIPQFFNVLLGQMSVVGPRPSPESENILCPHWRDARLSVRPGITGLWQVCRTRERMKDFQEWIYYDIKYVRELSMKTDLSICWQTAKGLLKNFVRRF